MTELHHLRTQAEVVRFVEHVRLFCRLLEVEPGNRQDWMLTLLTTLADLYAAAHHLAVPDNDLASDFPEETFDPTPGELQAVRQRVGRVLGEDNLYWCTLNVRLAPTGPERGDSLGVGDLTDDLADIYRDLRPGLRAWDANVDAYLPDIIFGWKEPLFASHWGMHAVDALRALHSLVYEC